LPPGARKHFDEFHRCQECDQVYWKGAYYERMVRLIEMISG